MSIEIRNLSITSRVVQRQPEQAPAQPAERRAEADRRPSAGWDLERRRLVAQLQELRRER